MSRAVVQIKADAERNLIATWARNVPVGTTVEFRAPRRSNDQNALMWSLLAQVSKSRRLVRPKALQRGLERRSHRLAAPNPRRSWHRRRHLRSAWNANLADDETGIGGPD
jgi:hypothetical protein